MPTVTLRATPDAERPAPRITLGDLRGSDEIALSGIDTQAAVRLLDRLIGSGGGDAAARTLSASDRDRLLAALHRDAFGDIINATPSCAQCRERFDVSFSLSELQRHLDAGSAPGQGIHPPTAADEIAAADLPWDAGLAQLRAAAADAPADALAAAAPIVDLELEARCPECGFVQPASFDLQTFTLTALLNDRPALIQEIHLLASVYGWALHDILALSRADRRALVSAIDRERSQMRYVARTGWR